jgi:hypothetical protein
MIPHGISKQLRLLSLMHLHLLSQRVGGDLVSYADCLFVHPYFDLLGFSADFFVSRYGAA